MGALIGWLIILSVFGGIFYIVAKIEGFWVTLGLFTGAIAICVLLAVAEQLVKG